MTTANRRALDVRIGLASEQGGRESNEDFAAGCTSDPRGHSPRGAAAVVTDGVGGHLGGRDAAELTVRGFLEAYYALPETLGALRAASRSIQSINSWIYAQGRVDPIRAGMACAFAAVILTGRACHILHSGDCRVYRLRNGQLECLTADHVAGRGDLAHVLTRAIGLEEHARVDHAQIDLRQHDRFLLTSDGVHGALPARALAALLDARAAPDETAQAVVEAALGAGASDNCTALVVDTVDLPDASSGDLVRAVEALPIPPLPEPGETVDGFALKSVLSNGRYSRLFTAEDSAGKSVVLKFPHPRVAADTSYRLAFVREAWVASRVRSPLIGEIIEIPPERQTRLYSVMPFYEGETLEQRLTRAPPVSLNEGRRIVSKLALAVAALHRQGVIHRDIKPDNVILLAGGGLRLIDLGVAHVPRLEDFPAEDIPGTPSYMAPELFHGRKGDEASDLYACGVTVYRMFAQSYPYGEVEPFSRPRFGKYTPLSRARPDLPAWLDAAVARAVSVDPARRFGDCIEFAHEIENGAAPQRAAARRRPLYEANPLLVWKLLSAVLLALLMLALALGRR